MASAILIAAGAAAASPALAQVDTLDYTSTLTGSPVIASVPIRDLLPIYGAVHVAWTRGSVLVHAWKLPDPWQSETVVDNARSYALAVHGDGLPVIAFSDDGGRLICAERSPSGWSLDTIATYPGSSLRPAIALDPEPVIAYFETPASGPATLRYARRSGANWSIVDLDAGGFSWPPSLAIGPGGKRAVACPRAAGTLSGQELVWYEASTPGGPFTPAVVDTESMGAASLVWNASPDRAMVLYGAQRASDLGFEYRFAWRDNAGDWPRQVLGSTVEWVYQALSLGLDPAGVPGALWQENQYIVDAAAHGVNSCGTVETGTLQVSSQPAAAPSGPFHSTSLPRVFGDDSRTSTRAVASHSFGTFDVVWREPWSNCAPYGVFYLEVAAGVTAVPSAGGPFAVALGLGPNPRAGGEPIQLSWTLERGGRIEFVLYDVSGRIVARDPAGWYAAGAHARAWQPGGLPAGFYWVALQSGHGRLATRALVTR